MWCLAWRCPPKQSVVAKTQNSMAAEAAANRFVNDDPLPETRQCLGIATDIAGFYFQPAVRWAFSSSGVKWLRPTTALACMMALLSLAPRASAPSATCAHIRRRLGVLAFFVFPGASLGSH